MGRKPFPKPRFHTCPMTRFKELLNESGHPMWQLVVFWAAAVLQTTSMTSIEYSIERSTKLPHVLLILSRILTRVRNLTFSKTRPEKWNLNIFPLAHIIQTFQHFPQGREISRLEGSTQMGFWSSEAQFNMPTSLIMAPFTKG